MKAIKKLLVVMNKVTAYYRHNHSVNAIPEKAMIVMCNAQIDAEKEVKELEQQNKEILSYLIEDCRDFKKRTGMYKYKVLIEKITGKSIEEVLKI